MHEYFEKIEIEGKKKQCRQNKIKLKFRFEKGK